MFAVGILAGAGISCGLSYSLKAQDVRNGRIRRVEALGAKPETYMPRVLAIESTYMRHSAAGIVFAVAAGGAAIAYTSRDPRVRWYPVLMGAALGAFIYSGVGMRMALDAISGFTQPTFDEDD